LIRWWVGLEMTKWKVRMII